MSGVEIVRYAPELKEPVLQLWQERPRRYLEWKYEENPYLPEPVLFVAVDAEGSVVGTRGFCGSRWQTPEEAVVIPCAEDFTIADHHRNTGLATAIMRAALADLERGDYRYVLSTSAGEITVLHSIAMGWKSIGAMEPVAWSARRKRTARVVRDVRSRLGGGESSPFERLDHVGSRPATAPGGAIVVESSPHPAAMAELADRLPFDGRIRHVRDGAFFDWRYRDPREEYRFLRYEIDGRTDGYLVISRGGAARSLAGPGRSHHVADWEGTSVEIRAELIESALAWAGFERLYAWTGNLTAKSKAVLERSGFEPARPELRARGMPCVLLKVLGPPGEQSVGGLSVVEPSHWDVRLIDSFR